MYPAALITTRADYTAVGNVAASFATLVMVVGGRYQFVSTTNCWIKQGAAPTATAAAGSSFVPANTPVTLAGDNGAALSVLRDTADGKASLTPVQA